MHLHHSSFELKTFHSNAKYSLYITVYVECHFQRKQRPAKGVQIFAHKYLSYIEESLCLNKEKDWFFTHSIIRRMCVKEAIKCDDAHERDLVTFSSIYFSLTVLSTFLLQFYLLFSKSETLTLLFLSLSHFLLTLILSHVPQQFNPWKQQIFQHVSYKLFMMMITIKNSSLRLESLFRQEWIALLMFVWKSSHWRRKWVNSQRESQSAWILHGRWFVSNLDMRERWEWEKDEWKIFLEGELTTRVSVSTRVAIRPHVSDMFYVRVWGMKSSSVSPSKAVWRERMEERERERERRKGKDGVQINYLTLITSWPSSFHYYPNNYPL